MKKNTVLAVIIGISLIIIGIGYYLNHNGYMETIEGYITKSKIEKQKEVSDKKFDPKNKELVKSLRTQVDKYVKLAKENKIDYSDKTPDELIDIELNILKEIKGQMDEAIKNYDPADEVSTFEKIRPKYMENAGKWAWIIKFTDDVPNIEDYNEARRKRADEIRTTLEALMKDQAEVQHYPEGMLNTLMFKRILDEVSERGKFAQQKGSNVPKTPEQFMKALTTVDKSLFDNK